MLNTKSKGLNIPAVTSSSAINPEAGLVFDKVSVELPSKDGRLKVLQEINLNIPTGAFATIIGPSGCGKTTLLNLIAGFAFPSAGRVLIDGNQITQPGRDRAVVFQQTTALLPWLNVESNIGFGLKLAGVNKAERNAKVEYYLQRVGLEAFKKHRLYELSGGMIQRVAVARALAIDPQIVLLDEPFGALDALTRDSMQDFVLEIWKNSKRTFVLITHSIEEALYLGTIVIVLSRRPASIVSVQKGFATNTGSSDQVVKSTDEFVTRREKLRKLLAE